MYLGRKVLRQGVERLGPQQRGEVAVLEELLQRRHGEHESVLTELRLLDDRLLPTGLVSVRLE